VGQLLSRVLPPGVLNVVTGPDPLGAAMVSHPLPGKVSFTGSTATGKKVAAAAACDLKRVTLELGGNDPAIVLEDADVGQIAEKLFWGAFGNNGQVSWPPSACTCIEASTMSWSRRWPPSPAQSGYFYAPTILDQVTDGIRGRGRRTVRPGPSCRPVRR
jgi:acyl-CoA reductase-like NAD-dependent aldehyde dehydrogenase